MSTETTDVIDLLAGIEPGSGLSDIRARRLQARENAQKSYIALFEPVDFGDIAAAERYAVAAFVAGVHDEPAAAGFYFAKLAKAADRLELVDALKAEIERARTARTLWRLSGRAALGRGQGRPGLSRCRRQSARPWRETRRRT